MNFSQNVNSEEIDTSIHQLKLYLKEASIEPLITALEALKNDPNNKSLRAQLSQAFINSASMQGAILTYAPYIRTLIPDDPFDSL